MKISELIRLLEDFEKNTEVYIKTSDPFDSTFGNALKDIEKYDYIKNNNGEAKLIFKI